MGGHGTAGPRTPYLRPGNQRTTRPGEHGIRFALGSSVYQVRAVQRDALDSTLNCRQNCRQTAQISPLKSASCRSGAKGTRTPDLTRQNTDLPAVRYISVRFSPARYLRVCSRVLTPSRPVNNLPSRVACSVHTVGCVRPPQAPAAHTWRQPPRCAAQSCS